MYFQLLKYLGSQTNLQGCQAIIVGLPYDGTASHRRGSRFAPNAIRTASVWNLETYDPMFDGDLAAFSYCDEGDLMEAASGSIEDYLHQERLALAKLPQNIPVVAFGGEHSITLPLVELALRRNPELALIIIDAHTDLRDSYDNTHFSHACITRRLVDLIGAERIALFGVRSGTREEFSFARKHQMLHELTPESINVMLERLGNRPLYLSIDLDAFDPMEAPGTGTPEPGGIHWCDLAGLLLKLHSRCIIGADLVELVPDLDHSNRSSILAARIVRAVLLQVLRSSHAENKTKDIEQQDRNARCDRQGHQP